MRGKNKKLLLVGFIALLFIVGFTAFKISQNTLVRNSKKEVTNNKQDNNISQNSKEDKDKSKVKIQNNKRTFQNMPLKYNDKSVPVLMYHSIDYEKGNDLRLPKEQLREQMKYLKNNGYTALTLEELYDFLVNNKPVPEKSIVITLDDGYEDNYTNALPVFKEFGFNATVFMITNTVDGDKRCLTSEQLKEMGKKGVSIESHTLNHDELNKLSYADQLRTLSGSKEYLEKTLNKKIEFIAYPFGKYNGNTVKAAESAGYKMAFTTEGGWANKSNGILTLHRVYISSSAGMKDFINRITNPNYNK